MRKFYIYLLILFGLCSTNQAISQCTTILNGPFPLSEYQQYNCTSGLCNSPTFINAPWQPGDGWAIQAPQLIPGNVYFIDFSVDPATAPFAGQLEITIFNTNTLDVVQFGPGLQMEFQLPENGNYAITISPIAGCGAPVTIGPFNDFIIDAFCPLFCPMSREDAVNALLSDPLFIFDSTSQILACPFIDFGGGPGFEGLLPAGTQFGSASDLWVETPPAPKFFAQPGYLFYLDLLPGSLFQHDVQYFAVDAMHPAPTIDNGGILTCPSDFWPYVEIFPALPLPLWPNGDYFTDSIPGILNPEGLVGGPALPANFDECYTTGPAMVSKPGNKCGLAISGFDANRAKNSVRRAKERMNIRDCYDKDRITTINNATQQQLCDAIDDMLAMDPACTEICIYIIAHGIERADGTTVGGFGVNGGMITPGEWQAKMDSIAKRGIVTHITFETCRSTAIGNPFNWGLPPGSTVTFASGANEDAWAYTYKTPACDTVTEGIFTHAVESCRADVANADANKDGSVSYIEGVQWVIKDKPCYRTLTPPTAGRYPAGPPTDSVGANPMPSYVNIGRVAGSISRKYRMPATFNPDKVCIRVRGDRRNGTGLVYTADGNTFVPHTQTKTYDADKNETEICFVNASSFTAGVCYWFHYYDNTGVAMTVLGARAKTCPPLDGPNTRSLVPPEEAEMPTTETYAALNLDGSAMEVTVYNRGVVGHGNGIPVSVDVGYRISNDSLPNEELNDGHTNYTSLPLVVVDTNVLLDTNQSYQFLIDIPQVLLPGQYLLVELNHTWSHNTTEAKTIDQFAATGVATCESDIIYTGSSTIPDLTNSSTFITLDGVIISNTSSAFNAETEINILSDSEIPAGKEALFFILGCDPP